MEKKEIRVDSRFTMHIVSTDPLAAKKRADKILDGLVSYLNEFFPEEVTHSDYFVHTPSYDAVSETGEGCKWCSEMEACSKHALK